MPANEDWPIAGARPWHEEEYTVQQSTAEHGRAPLWRVWRGRKFIVAFKTREEAERTCRILQALQRRRRRW